MSTAFTISKFGDPSAAIQKLVEKTSPRAVGEIVWPPALELTKRQLTAYKNTRGFPSQGFGEQLADSARGMATAAGAWIVIPGQGARLLFMGGLVKPVNKRMLCFPIAADSYGKSLPEMFGGEIPPRKQRTPDQNAKLKALRQLFAFAPQVKIKPHPELIPSPEQYRKVAVKAIGAAIEGGFHA